MSSVSSSSSRNSTVSDVVLRALQYEDDDAEHGSSIESDDDVILAPTPPKLIADTHAPENIKDFDLYGIVILEDGESFPFPTTPEEFGECTPVYRQPRANELSLRNQLHIIYSALDEHMDQRDIDLLSYSSHQRRILKSLIVLLREKMSLFDTDFYQKYCEVVETRFQQMNFKDYFPKE